MTTTDPWGICFGPAWGSSVAELLAPAREAERRGFGRIAVGEYHNDGLTWLQALALATERVPVASTILNVYLRHPAVVAEGIAAIRDACGDRIELGLGLSHRSIVERDLGLSLHGGLDYLEEYAGAVRALHGGEPFAGHHLRAEPALRRRRLVPGTMPVLVAALGQAAVERAARYADGIILTWTPPGHTADLVARARSVEAAHGRSACRVWMVLPCFMGTGDDAEAAALAARRALLDYLRLPAYRRMLAAAGYGAPAAAALAALAHGDLATAARALPEQMVRAVAVTRGREELDRLAAAYQTAGVDELILYPLPVAAGWAAAVRATLDRCAPA